MWVHDKPLDDGNDHTIYMKFIFSCHICSGEKKKAFWRFPRSLRRLCPFYYIVN